MILLTVGKLLVAKIALDLDAWLQSERDAILNAYLPGASHASYTGNTALFLSIHTADPGNTGASETVAYSGGLRPSIAFPASSGQSAGNTAQIDFASFSSSVTVTHVGVWTANTAGTFKGGGALSASKTPAIGDTLRFAATTGVVASLA